MDPKFEKVLKIYGILVIGFSALAIPILVIVVLAFIAVVSSTDILDVVNKQTLVLIVILLVVTVITVAQSVLLGVRLLRKKYQLAAAQLNLLMATLVASLLLDIMVSGLDWTQAITFAHLVFLVVMSSHIDPALREERQLQRHLHALEDKADAEDGVLGRDKSGKGFISLNFFNLFWIFVVCCILGDIIETVYHFVLYDFEIMNRTGMLWGPFSPIYGFGATLMTIALNRFYDRNFAIIYTVSALIGGVFEYAVSWFFQFAFGITAWDYSDAFLNIGGRTDLVHMLMWGLLGLVWIKLCLPQLLKLINKIPWNWRYIVTVAAATFMLVNGSMTMICFDCWFQRVSGQEPQVAISKFCAKHYDNDFMENRFQTMTIDPSTATRS